MSSEQRGPTNGETNPKPPGKEQRHEPYYLAARFESELPATLAYTQAQGFVLDNERADLSVYRLLIDQVSHVAVIGAPPPEELQQQLLTILSLGELAHLLPEVVAALHERRAKLKQLGHRVEGHYRPGKKLEY